MTPCSSTHEKMSKFPLDNQKWKAAMSETTWKVTLWRQNIRGGWKWEGWVGEGVGYNRAILGPCSVTGSERREWRRGGSKWASSEKQNRGGERRGGMSALKDDSRRAPRWEGKKGRQERGQVGRKGCWCFAVALGVVKILQQRASPLLSDVHLILQILHHENTNKQKHYFLSSNHL